MSEAVWDSLVAILSKSDMQALDVFDQEEPVYWQGRYWTGSSFRAFQRALKRSQSQWAEADKALEDRCSGEITIRWEEP